MRSDVGELLELVIAPLQLFGMAGEASLQFILRDDEIAFTLPQRNAGLFVLDPFPAQSGRGNLEIGGRAPRSFLPGQFNFRISARAASTSAASVCAVAVWGQISADFSSSIFCTRERFARSRRNGKEDAEEKG